MTRESGTVRRAVLELGRVEWREIVEWRESGTAHVHHKIEQLQSLVKGQYWNWRESGMTREREWNSEMANKSLVDVAVMEMVDKSLVDVAKKVLHRLVLHYQSFAAHRESCA